MTRVGAIVGATAVGKTDLALSVAEEIGAEIVSIDSMQVYRGMDIGTAKPSARDRGRAPHHVIDIFDPSRDVTVAEFQALARDAIADITRRGRLPLLVGGSGLYYRAVVDDLTFPPSEPIVRSRLEMEAEELGAETLHQRLSALDPAAAAKIDPGNARRTVRALEVVELTGRPFSDNTSWERYESIYALTVFGLTRDREVLYERIAERVRRMLDEGLIEEARTIARHGLSRTARQALGYRQILDEKATAPDDVFEGIVAATRRFARRQESWFRADPRIEWLDASDPRSRAVVVSRLRTLVRVT